MPKKSKTGKSRKDEYYHMAKSTGLRARSAFKLIEINKLFHFLEKANILIDLCAAPGGWMQVAAKTMKNSSFIIGIDLDPIKPIAGTISIQADITTDQCKQAIRKHILKAKADVILHDGAPNVGADWNVDGFTQSNLCLKAFALATEFLAQNGTFVTKVFRSKDYESLRWVFDQLFHKVQVVKPKSSRNESAEIFLVCLKYKAPSYIDPKFLDIQYVFEDVEEVNESVLSIDQALKRKKKAVGYDDNGDSVYKEVNVSELLTAKIPLNVLLTSNKIIFDDDEIKNHPSTTETIKQYLMDLKLLGKIDFKKIMKWVKPMAKIYRESHNLNPEKIVFEKPEVVEKTEEEQIEEEIEKCEEEIKKSEKKKLKKMRQEKMKQIKLIQMSMLHPGDVIEQDYDIDLFSASKNQDLIEKGLIETEVDISKLDELINPIYNKRKKKEIIEKPTKEHYKKDSEKHYDDGSNLKYCVDSDKDSDEEEEEEVEEIFEIPTDGEENEGEESEIEDEEQESLIEEEEQESEIDDESDENESDEEMEIEEESEENESDEEMEVEEESEEIEEELEEDDEDEDEKPAKRQKITDLDFDPNAPTRKQKEAKRNNMWFERSEFTKLMNDDDDDSDSDSDSESNEIIEDISDETKTVMDKQSKKELAEKSTDKIDINNPDHKMIINTLKRKLTPKERALAAEMIKSKKSRREIIEWGYNRYQFDDEKLPSWFVEDEKKHMVARLPFLNKASVDAQKAAVSTTINKRTIKKVEQAKARKKNKVMRKLSRLNKRADNMDDDLTQVEKSKKLRDLQKKVSKIKNTRKPVVTSVTNKSGVRSRVGEFKKGAKSKIVDRRMKKDTRAQKAKDKKNKNRRRK